MSEASMTPNTTDAELEFSLRHGLTLAFIYNEHQIILNFASFSSREQIWVDDQKVNDVKNFSFQSRHEIQVADETMSIAINVSRMMTKMMVTVRVGEHLVFDRDILASQATVGPHVLILSALIGAAVGYAFASVLL